MIEGDSRHRFLIERTSVRGEWVHLNATWQAVLERADYPPEVQRVLGETLAAVALLSATIKFEGSLIVQVQGDGPISMLVAQATAQRTLRGLAHWRSAIPDGGSLHQLFGNGRIVITIDPGEGLERYQGVVGLAGANVADALASYFELSEQLPTRMWLAADDERVGGFLLQRMPGQDLDPDAWNRAVTLAETLSRHEILDLAVAEVLHRLYHEEDVRLFEREPMSFRCTCSRGRVENLLRALGIGESRSIIAEQGEVKVSCEFCNARFIFDAVDVEQIFAGSESPISPSSRH